MSERRRNRRLKSFLRGFVYFDKRRGALSCVVRDLADDGARIVFSQSVAIPNIVNLHLPQKDQTLRARVSWRRGDEIGLSFIAVETPVSVPVDAKELMKRVTQLETEIASLRRMLRRMKSRQGPSHLDDDEAVAFAPALGRASSYSR